MNVKLIKRYKLLLACCARATTGKVKLDCDEYSTLSWLLLNRLKFSGLCHSMVSSGEQVTGNGAYPPRAPSCSEKNLAMNTVMLK